MTAFKLLCCSTVVMALYVLSVSDLRAQVKNVKVNGAGLNGMLGGGALAASDPDEMTTLLYLRIEELQEAVGLDQKQVRRMKLAAKVVAGKVFEERQNPLLVPMGKSNSLEAVDSFSDEDSESKEGAKTIEQNLHEFELPVAYSTALKHHVWRKAQESVFTSQQQVEIQEYQRQRDQEAREAAVRYRVLQLAEQLRLRHSQLVPLAKVVDDIEGEQLVNDLRRGDDGVSLLDMAGNAPQPKTITASDVEDILSQRQLARFKHNQDGGGQAGGLRQLLGFVPPVDESDSLTFSDLGVSLKRGQTIVKFVQVGSVAEKVGVKAGDLIDEINETPVDTLFQIKKALKLRSGLSITVIRDGEIVCLETK